MLYEQSHLWMVTWSLTSTDLADDIFKQSWRVTWNTSISTQSKICKWLKQKHKTLCLKAYIEFFENVVLSNSVKPHFSFRREIPSWIHWLIAYYHITSMSDFILFTKKWLKNEVLILTHVALYLCLVWSPSLFLSFSPCVLTIVKKHMVDKWDALFFRCIKFLC